MLSLLFYFIDRTECIARYRECQIANLFKLTRNERYRLQQLWKPKVGQRIVHIDKHYNDAILYYGNHLFNSQNGTFLYKRFPNYLFDCTDIIGEIDLENNLLIKSHVTNNEHKIVYKYPISECYPLLNRWQLYWWKRKLKRRKELI